MPFPYRIATLMSPEDVGAAGTRVIDIDLSEVISRIVIKFKSTNAASASHASPMANLPRIEVVDGSDVLFSTNGEACDAVDFYDRGKAECSSWTYINAWAIEALVGINFGRTPYDPTYALDPRKFHNLQLKITWDEDVANTNNTVNAMEVWAMVFDGMIVNPIGFFQTKEQFAYTPTANAYQEIELPTDHILRTLYLQAPMKDTWFGSIVADVRLDEDNLRAIYFDNEYYDVMKQFRPHFGRYEHKISAYIDTTDTEYYRGPTSDVAVSMLSYGAAEYALLEEMIFGAAGAAMQTTAGNVVMFASGYLPHYVGAFPFGIRPEPSSWYNPGSVQKLRFRIQGGAGLAGTETFRVITQQVRHY